MKAEVVLYRHPLTREGESREMRVIRRGCRIRALAPQSAYPTICLLNGKPILRAQWRRRLRGGDRLVFVQLPQGGGDGGSNPVAAVAMIALMIAAPYIVAGIGGEAMTAAGVAAAESSMGAFAFGLAKVGVMMAGSMLINAVLPNPGLPSSQRANEIAAPSPTYTLSSQGNSARLYQAIPELFGRHLIYMDRAAQAYAEFAGNEQYLYQLFTVSRGEVEIEQVRIEDTPMSTYAEVETEIIPPGGQVTLFPASVVSAVEVSGQELPGKKAMTWSAPDTSAIIITQAGHGLTIGTKIEVDLNGVMGGLEYTVATCPDADTFTVAQPAQTDGGTWSHTGSGSGFIRRITGPFAVVPAGQQADRLAFDLVAIRGLFVAGEDGGLGALTIQVRIDLRQINDAGEPLGAWVPATVTDTLARTHYWSRGYLDEWTTWRQVAFDTDFSPTAHGEGVAAGYWLDGAVVTSVPPGQEEDAQALSWHWQTFGAGYPEPPGRTYSAEVTAITLTGATTTPQRRTYRTTVTPGRYEARAVRLDVKNASGQAGHDIAWAGLRAYIPGEHDYGDVTLLAVRMRASNQLSSAAASRVNVIATRKLPHWTGTGWSAPLATRSIADALAYLCKTRFPDSRIALDELEQLDAVWSARGDCFDGVFDQKLNLGEAVSQVARAGRAKYYEMGGKIHFARDRQQTIPVAMFTADTVVARSVSTEYAMAQPDRPDGILAQYLSADTWRPADMAVPVPGQDGVNLQTARYFGITGRDQLWREVSYDVRAAEYRTITHTFGVEAEGVMLRPYDLIGLTRDRVGQGQSLVAQAWDGETGTLWVRDAPDWSEEGNHYIILRRRDAGAVGPYRVTRGSDDRALVVESAYLVAIESGTALPPDTGLGREPTYISFGVGTQTHERLIVLGTRPTGPLGFEVIAVVEDDRVHEDPGPAPEVSSAAALTTATRPLVSNVRLVITGISSSPTYSVSWSPAPGASSYLVEASQDGQVWTRVGDTTASSLIFTPQWSGAQVRVAGLGAALGQWVMATESASQTQAVPTLTGAGGLSISGGVSVDGVPVIGGQQPSIANAESTIDVTPIPTVRPDTIDGTWSAQEAGVLSDCRGALDVLRTSSEANAAVLHDLQDRLNAALGALRAHGLISTTP